MTMDTALLDDCINYLCGGNWVGQDLGERLKVAKEAMLTSQKHCPACNVSWNAPVSACPECGKEIDFADLILRINEFGLHPDLTDADLRKNVPPILEDCRGFILRHTVARSESVTRDAVIEECASVLDKHAKNAREVWDSYLAKCRENPVNIGAGSQSWHQYYEAMADAVRRLKSAT